MDRRGAPDDSMTSLSRLNELTAAEGPARELIERLGYTHMPREVLTAEREVLLRDRLNGAGIL